jgi:preprotein translocase subunit SecY
MCLPESVRSLYIKIMIDDKVLMKHQVLCHVLPSLVKLRKEGLDGHEKIKSYIWWLSFFFAIVEALVVAYTSLQYSVFAATAQ